MTIGDKRIMRTNPSSADDADDVVGIGTERADFVVVADCGPSSFAAGKSNGKFAAVVAIMRSLSPLSNMKMMKGQNWI
jgi:hypothetical protein